MARKSAAKVKPIKVANSDKFLKENQLPPIEETFDNAKQAFLITLDTSIKLAHRVDNLLNLRDYAYKFWGNDHFSDMLTGERVKYFKELQDISIETYQKIREAVESFELDEFLKDDMKDYFEYIMPNVDLITNEGELCYAGLIFLTVKPFGEKMAALHHTMLDEKKQREVIEEEFGD